MLDWNINYNVHDVFRLPYGEYFGGVTAMSRTHFELINGFSNIFWGWGGEDDDLYYRTKGHNLNITRYPPEVACYHSLSHAKQKANPHRYKKDNHLFECLKVINYFII